VPIGRSGQEKNLPIDGSIRQHRAMGVAVRRVRPDEGLVLKEIRLGALLDSPFAFGSTYAAEAELTDEQWMHRATLSSSGSDRVTFLAWTDRRATGLVGGYRVEHAPETVELVSMWAAPEARRSGAGRLLVQAIIDWAIEAGSSAVELWVTRGNEPAQRFYESLGFRETGEHQPLPSDPCKEEVRMVLAVTP
jgi:GNAT superfamily N-acetyltransferase